MNNPLFIPPSGLSVCVLLSMSHSSLPWWVIFLAYKEEVHIAAYDGQRECFSKTGAVAILRSVTIERLIHESIHSSTRDTRERNRKKREHFLELQSLWMTWWEKKLVKMKVWFIYYYSSFLLNVFITHSFF